MGKNKLCVNYILRIGAFPWIDWDLSIMSHSVKSILFIILIVYLKFAPFGFELSRNDLVFSLN